MKLLNMKRMSLGWAMLAGAALAACSSEAESLPGEASPISFSAQVGSAAQTRITNNAWDGDELVGIKMGTAVKTYKVDTGGKMSTDDTEPFTWEEGTTASVLAWTPMTDGEINLKEQTTEAKFFDCDLLKSTTQVTSASVTLAFGHKMTRMQWEILTFEGYTEAEIESAEVTFFGYGAVKFAEGELQPIGDKTAQLATWKEGAKKGEAMMVPCEMWDLPLIQVKIGEDKLVYTPRHSNATDEEKKTGILKEDTWQRYYLQIAKKTLTVSMEYRGNIDDWNDKDDNMGLIEPDGVIE